MKAADLVIPDYHRQTPEVAERFRRIREREVILRIEKLAKNFEADGECRTVFSDLTLDIHRREFICVIGPSGCGKSTLIRIVAGLDECSGGDILLDGKSVWGPGPDRGMVFQGYTLFPWLTVKRNVMFGMKMNGLGRTQAEREALQWLDLVGLTKFADVYPHQLSGGMKQRGALAR